MKLEIGAEYEFHSFQFSRRFIWSFFVRSLLFSLFYFSSSLTTMINYQRCTQTSFPTADTAYPDEEEKERKKEEILRIRKKSAT